VVGKVVVLPVYERDAAGRALEAARGRDAAEPAADHHHVRQACDRRQHPAAERRHRSGDPAVQGEGPGTATHQDGEQQDPVQAVVERHPDLHDGDRQHQDQPAGPGPEADGQECPQGQGRVRG